VTVRRTYLEARVMFSVPITCVIDIWKIDAVGIMENNAVGIMKIETAGIAGIEMADTLGAKYTFVINYW